MGYKFFFVLALAGRTLRIGLVERPLFIGLVWWVCTDSLAPTLPLALFFEMFWLDLFPIGSFTPPMAAFPYLLLLALDGSFGWHDPAILVLPLAVSLPLAYSIPCFENRLSDLRKSLSSRLVHHAKKKAPLGALPGSLIFFSCLQQIGGGGVLFLAAYAGLHFLFSFILSGTPLGDSTRVISLNVSWPVIYAVGAIGALLALRIKRAYMVFSLCMGVLLVLTYV